MRPALRRRIVRKNPGNAVDFAVCAIYPDGMGKKREKIDEACTSFRRWRLMMGLTQAEAAALLGKSPRAIWDYERPKNPVVPSYADRVLMDLLAKGKPVSAWPE